jgi:hypothetical protein
VVATAPARRARWLGGLATSLAIAAYYWLFFLPPRLVGSNDPDRYYHLGLARIASQSGLPRVLPQVEDLGWGRYFPDQEFLFHALTASADWLGGESAVLMLVPLLGVAIAASLYVGVSRVLRPGIATAFVLAAFLLSPVLVFRLTMLRPHLLAILCFCLLVLALLRGRGWMAALAAAAFALGYHALYIPLIAIAMAGFARLPPQPGRLQPWQLALFGLVAGSIVNPYFPSTIAMSWLHLKLALGIGLPPGLVSGTEVQPISLEETLAYFGFLPRVLAGAAVLLWRERGAPARDHAEFRFLFLLSLALTALCLKNSRASEYATPVAILLGGYCLARVPPRRWLGAALLALALTQGKASWIYYKDCWTLPQGGYAPAYLAAAALLPPEADGRKVFNCEWEAGSYLLMARPRVRFVDLLEPAFLWQASPAKYLAKQRLVRGLEPDPHRVLVDVFHADYVLCGTPALNYQMESDHARFRAIPAVQPMNSLRVYEVRR